MEYILKVNIQVLDWQYINVNAGRTTHNYLESEGHDLENKLEGEYSSEYEVEDVQGVGVRFRLPSKLHGQGHRVEHNEHKDGVLKGL